MYFFFSLGVKRGFFLCGSMTTSSDNSQSSTASACEVEGSVSSEAEPDTGSLEKYFQRAIARAAGVAKVLSCYVNLFDICGIVATVQSFYKVAGPVHDSYVFVTPKSTAIVGVASVKEGVAKKL